MVRCINTYSSENCCIAFLKNRLYKVLDDYIGTIVIEDEGGNPVPFDTPDSTSSFQYTNWFEKVGR